MAVAHRLGRAADFEFDAAAEAGSGVRHHAAQAMQRAAVAHRKVFPIFAFCFPRSGKDQETRAGGDQARQKNGEDHECDRPRDMEDDLQVGCRPRLHSPLHAVQSTAVGPGRSVSVRHAAANQRRKILARVRRAASTTVDVE